MPRHHLLRRDVNCDVIYTIPNYCCLKLAFIVYNKSRLFCKSSMCCLAVPVYFKTPYKLSIFIILTLEANIV